MEETYVYCALMLQLKRFGVFVFDVLPESIFCFEYMDMLALVISTSSYYSIPSYQGLPYLHQLIATS